MCQPRCHVGDIEANVARHVDAIDRAEADVVVFPELSLTGYDMNAPTVDGDEPELADLVAVCNERSSLALVGAPVYDVDRSRRFIATMAITSDGAVVAYRKTHLGGDEALCFSDGGGFNGAPGPVILTYAGWRIALAICKDTGTPGFIDQLADQSPDLVAAGLVHHHHERTEQDRRGQHIAKAVSAPVAFASAAGTVGPDYDQDNGNAAVGHSTIWAADGSTLVQADAKAGRIVRTELFR